MDNVLFYGQGDEASRRQVRSAAAQYSHRVGPRKPKKSLRENGREGGGGVRRRTAHQKTASTASSSTSSPDDAGDAGDAPPAQSATASVAPSVPTACRAEAAAGDAAFAMANQGHDEGIQTRGGQARNAISSSQSFHPSYGRPPSPQSRYCAPYQRSGQSAYPDRRLPQYSWTEYPRYGLSSGQPQSLQMLAQLASASQQYAGRTTVDRPQLPPPHSSRSLFLHSRACRRSDGADAVQEE
ncbi:uncharacterized protein MYCFIDRAFT_212405 [Pseudocercospora fijiensis CIRAD86]|uniref:Uncharacterized protein n=1 Tax=Pseudocercospora fijiensis (strain CIRAD86) TaxID=383855 RepID=M3AN06_PSEFD|nr:uncharacterized protein MYCFIDRAFT_212405 [Pseudocercospora fijiensis CIRAD86]EME78513.1 hypothetical protein MYCFIDRAFT_212405 [Pseudocercospora fijiensis CIRAD86]